MTTHLLTCADNALAKASLLCVESGKQHGVDNATIVHLASSAERGLGYWKWKPEMIEACLRDPNYSDCKDGDILIYSDAGVEFINSVNWIIDRMDQDVWLFGNQYEHAHWCKRDIVDEIFSAEKLPDFTHWALPAPWGFFGKQVQASVIFFRVNEATRAFVKEWLDWCLFEGGRLIDDSPSRTSNHPEFQENRHDQAILTTMAYRDGIKLHWWPASYNEGAFEYPRGDYPDEGYPILFHHHRGVKTGERK